MKTFVYSGVDMEGVPQAGTLKAISRQQAVNNLRAKNYIITKLQESSALSFGEFLARFKGVPKREVVVFTRQMGTMIGAGLPINQAMRILSTQTQNKYFAQVISDVIQQIDGGSSLHDSLSNKEKVFNRLYLSLVKAGESSGNLETILARLADTMEADQEFKGKVKGALVYPAIIMMVMVGVLLIMFFFVIPQLSKMYEDMNAELPFMTQLIVNMSDFLINFWWLAGLILVGMVIGLKRLMKIPSFARQMAAVTLKLPVFGALGMEVQMTSFTRTLSMLVASGIPLLEGIDISRETLSNQIYREAAQDAATMIEKGKPLAESFRKYKEFPPLLSEMLSVGEQTGKVDEVLGKVSQYFEAQAARKTENLASAIEPIVMVMLGVMVGFLVIALIMPIYSLTSSFS